MLVARLQIGQPSIGDDWLILSFAAPVIGGAVLAGGHVSVAGTLLGVVIVAIITQALVLFQIDPFVVQVVLGVPDPVGGRRQPLARGQRRARRRGGSEHGRACARGARRQQVFPGVKALADVDLDARPRARSTRCWARTAPASRR